MDTIQAFMEKGHLHTHIDHLVVTAPNLAQGVAYVEASLGVKLEPGGSHPGMGTHNALLKLGENTYLEVIANEPGKEVLYPHRWFELDELRAHDEPRLRTWAAATNNLLGAQAYAPQWFGKAEALSRGDLSWWITLPIGRFMPLGGICPALIQWPSGVHPCQRLKDQGCSLLSLELYTDQAKQVQEIFRQIKLDGALEIKELSLGLSPCLLAKIQTPYGERTLASST